MTATLYRSWTLPHETLISPLSLSRMNLFEGCCLKCDRDRDPANFFDLIVVSVIVPCDEVVRTYDARNLVGFRIIVGRSGSNWAADHLNRKLESVCVRGDD
eukprot:748081-Hanusia_phi.AAC.3